MAGEPSSLLSEFAQAVKDWTRTKVTGKYPAGSIEDLEGQLKLAQAQQALDAVKRDPNDPRARERLNQALRDRQDIVLRGQQATIDMMDNRLPTLVGAKGQLADIETRSTTTVDRAKTENDLRRIAAQREILGDTFGHEMGLAQMGADTRDAVLQFYSQAQDKNLAAQAAAQKEARNFNISTMLNNLPGLALAVAGTLA